MLKSFSEMMKCDISAYVKQRDGLDYLPWAACLKLLHDNGAEVVYFEPITNPKDGTSLFYTERSFGDPGKKDAKFNSCYETAVKIIIDDLVFEMRGPVTNGANPVQDNSMTQSRVYAAQKRLFVKGVAIRTGLGFNLWLKEEQEMEEIGSKFDDLSAHDIMKVKERIQQLVTVKLDGGLSLDEIAKKTEVGPSADDVRELIRQCTRLYNFEGMLKQI